MSRRLVVPITHRLLEVAGKRSCSVMGLMFLAFLTPWAQRVTTKHMHVEMVHRLPGIRSEIRDQPVPGLLEPAFLCHHLAPPNQLAEQRIIVAANGVDACDMASEARSTGDSFAIGAKSLNATT